MIKEINISLFATAALLLTSCTSEMPEVYPNGSDEIRISLGNGIASRAAVGYRDYDANTDPTTMGVIAFTNGTPDPYIYNNVSFSAPTSGTGAWDITTGTKAKWSEYYKATALDFFAYMPYQEKGATVSKSENTYTLTLTNVPGISDKPYLVATTPVHYTTAYGNVTPVQMQMDHLMTAFEFQFELGEAMSALRTFKITKVKMSEIPVTATVAQAYNFNGTWTKDAETISEVATSKTSKEVSSTEGLKIGYNNTGVQTFPAMLYMLPFTIGEGNVTPKIEVTYDVYDQDGYATRNVKNTILLNAANFGTTLGTGATAAAKKNTIKIKIVPTKLHILSDADQSTAGYLVVGE